MILTGVEHSRGLPPQMGLGDNSQEPRQRLIEGRWEYAHERVGELALSLRTDEELAELF